MFQALLASAPPEDYNIASVQVHSDKYADIIGFRLKVMVTLFYY